MSGDAWQIVDAALRLSKPAIAFAAHLIASPPYDQLPADLRAKVYGLLHALGDVGCTPAVEALLAAHAAAQAGHGDVQRSPAWRTVCALRQERNALAALLFMHLVAGVEVQLHGGESLRL